APMGFYQRLATESLDRKHSVLRDWRVTDTEVEVGKDTVLAQIDDAVPRTQVEQARLAVRTAEANLAQQRATANQKAPVWQRDQELRRTGNLSVEEFDQARADNDTAQATVAGGIVAVDLAKANLKQAEINLGYTTIRSPVPGVVITKQVNVGQTVVSAQTA